ncbi:MAG TPA: DUF2127 domain-containing protein [Microcoleaceae cyanobacterium]
MISSAPRPASLKAIVAYKGLIVVVLAAISLMSAFSWRQYDTLAAIAQTYLVDGELTFTDWLLKTVLHIQPYGLRLLARVSGVYAIVMGIATIGLWYGKSWANLLMLVMAGLPLPIELQEFLHQPSWQRFVIFCLNSLVVLFLLKHQFDARTISTSELEASVPD